MKTLKFSAVIIFFLSLFYACDTETVPDNIDVASELTGEWWCILNDGENENGFDVVISRVSDNEIKISNFHNLSMNESVIVKILQDNSLEMSEQTILNTTVKGTGGSVSSGYQSMSLQYIATDQDGSYNVTNEFSIGTVSKKMQ